MSEDQDDSQKTEEPTAKRLEKAHEQGQYAVSREVNNWMMIAATLVIVGWILPPSLRNLEPKLAFFIADSYRIPMDPGAARNVFVRAVIDTLLVLALPVLLLMAAGVAASILQNGLHTSWQPLQPDLGKLNPLNGFKRIFSFSHQGIEIAKNLVKFFVVAVVAYISLRPMLLGIEHFTGMDVMEMLLEIEHIAFSVLVGVLMAMTVIAGADLFWQRFDFNKKMRMTKQEIKDEYKQQEGDPIIKGRIRQLRMEKARRRMMAAVPQSDVVVTNPSHFAVAMKYDPASMGAPVVLAKGVDEVALNIRRVAAANEIPIVQNPPLARALYASAEIDQEIPAEHYRAVAEVISYVFKLKGRAIQADR